MKHKKWVVLNDNARWWKNSEEVEKWVIKDKNGDHWLINGSEFPEKKLTPSCKPLKEDKFSLLRAVLIVSLASALGVILAITFISLLFI
tara:strand:- start:2969 stop:3235 length:267 start_codon:yes stop_codon:yes gene_type:complete